MEDFALVEADFQQYYGIDLNDYYNEKIANNKGFWRYSRLFSELPVESRCIKKLNPVESWQWSDEWQVRALQELRQISTTLYNTNRQKGAKAAKVPEPFEPDYVTEARKDYEEWKKSQNAEVDDATKEFWEKRTGVQMT